MKMRNRIVCLERHNLSYGQCIYRILRSCAVSGGLKAVQAVERLGQWRPHVIGRPEFVISRKYLSPKFDALIFGALSRLICVNR